MFAIWLTAQVESARPIVFAFAAAACCELPLCLGGQIRAAPARVGERILIGDVNDRMIVFAADRAAGARRLTPVRTMHVLPPLGEAAVLRIGWLDEYDRARDEHLLRHSDVRAGIETALGEGP